MKALSLTAALTTLLLIGGASLAQNPAEDISPQRHPNLAAAQQLIRQAYDKIAAAQKANDYDMKGHAQKAKDLLDEASKELKVAAEEADRKGK